MDFITVTLRENYVNGKSISKSGKLENYLLPVLAIKSTPKIYIANV